MATPTRTTINLEPTDRKQLEASAAANERSVAAEARVAIRYYLDAVRKSTRRPRS